MGPRVSWVANILCGDRGIIQARVIRPLPNPAGPTSNVVVPTFHGSHERTYGTHDTLRASSHNLEKRKTRLDSMWYLRTT